MRSLENKFTCFRVVACYSVYLFSFSFFLLLFFFFLKTYFFISSFFPFYLERGITLTDDNRIFMKDDLNLLLLCIMLTAAFFFTLAHYSNSVYMCMFNRKFKTR